MDYSPKRWEIYLYNLYYRDDPTQYKTRPILIINGKQALSLAWAVSSKSLNGNYHEIEIDEWREAGLDKPSKIWLGETFEINNDDLLSKVGTLQKHDIDRVKSICSELGISFTENLNEALQHDTLNPAFWKHSGDEYILIPEVREKVKSIVEVFLEDMKEADIPIEYIDTYVLGSNASYNYTKHSDLDIHVVANLGEVTGEIDILQLLYNYFRTYFNDKYDISIKGYPVELYVEDINSNTVSNGIYSIERNKWVKKPTKREEPPTEVEEEVTYRYDELVKECNQIEGKEQAINLLNQLYLMRKESINLEGEFGVDNLVFKKLRDNGFLDELKEIVTEETSKELTLEKLSGKIYTHNK